jgi:hypothetical protein
MENKILHPILLQFIEIEFSQVPIFPKLNVLKDNKDYTSPYDIKKFNYVSNTNALNQNFDNFNMNYYLLINYNIENYDDAILFLNNIIEKNLNEDTINLFTTIIIENYYNIFFEMVNLDKIINFYIIYFKKYYDKNYLYKDIFDMLLLAKRNNIVDFKIHEWTIQQLK